MCVKDLIQTKNYSCHNILFHDILGCANTKQFFTRIYFIVSIWYSFFHSLHLAVHHDSDAEDNHPLSDDEEDRKSKPKPCNSYLTKLFAMTDFSFLTKSSSSSSSNSSSASSTRSISRSVSSSHSENNSLVYIYI